MDVVQKQQINGLIRALLSYGLGQLVGRGIFDQGIADQLLGMLCGVLIPTVWSMVEKVWAKKVMDAHVEQTVINAVQAETDKINAAQQQEQTK